MSKDCNYREVTAVQNREDAIRDTFIKGLLNSNIRQRFLENEQLDLQAAVTQAKALDTAQKNADSYRTHVSAMVGKTTFLHSVPNLPNDGNEEESACAASTKSTCYFSGFRFHPRSI